MAKARKKSSISVKVSRPHLDHHFVARTINVHRNANGRLGCNYSHTLLKPNDSLCDHESPESSDMPGQDIPDDGPDDLMDAETIQVECEKEKAPVVSSCFSAFYKFCLHSIS
jgi:hypothetical protein